MTIATLMGTCLIFTSIGWSGKFYEPLALVVGGMICIAAANAGGTSQDLKTGYIVGATPKYQQLSLFIGAIVSSVAIGVVVSILDTPTPAMISQGLTHAIGSDRYPAPQATLMATLAKGILSFNLDWQFVIVGVFIAITLELCGIKALAFISPFITGYLGENVNWHYGFAAAGVGMVIGLVYFRLTEKNLGAAGLRSNRTVSEEEKNRERKLWIGLWCVLVIVIVFVVLLLMRVFYIDPIAFARASGVVLLSCVLIYFIYVFTAEKLDPPEKKKIFAICVMFVITTTFYAGF